tara:strand:- start:545 stop:751 length:207 start_codon:yes stop_codon:yes gene_type:complete
MPIPNHCGECDKPMSNNDNWMCEACAREEARQQSMVSSNNTGVPLKDILPSMQDEDKDTQRSEEDSED